MICTVISIQYVKLVVLLGLALPVSEVLVSDIFPEYFEVSFSCVSWNVTSVQHIEFDHCRYCIVKQTFYLYLYLVSLLFMLYVYIASAWRHRRKVTVKRYRGKVLFVFPHRDGIIVPISTHNRLFVGQRGIRYRLKVLRQTRAVETVRYGSVYLRLAMNGKCNSQCKENGVT